MCEVARTGVTKDLYAAVEVEIVVWKVFILLTGEAPVAEGIEQILELLGCAG